MPDQATGLDDRQAPHPMLDHQRRRLLELHLRLTAYQRPRGVLADGWLGLGSLGKRLAPPGRGR